MFAVLAVVPTVMDGTDSEHQDKVKDIPPPPIKTYQWEDVKRARKRGLYPYTHLYKDPFNDEVDPEEFRMDSLRPKSKSVSPLPNVRRGVDIQEIIDDSKSEDQSRTHLEVEGIVEAPDSSIEDNISQYLDRDEDQPNIVEQEDVKEDIGVSTEQEGKHEETPKEEAGTSQDQEEKKEEDIKEEPGTSKAKEKMEVDEDLRDSRAKSEEPKRKRKLSIESAYSRISLSRLGVMKKLRAAKDKLRLPKLPFSKSESKLDEAKKPKTDKKDKKEKTTKQPTKQQLKPTADDKPPVYIHIPLKPPPGQTDEFSHLEFEDPEAPRTTPTKQLPSEGEKPTEEQAETTPVVTTPQNGQITNDVQFIFLTAPSDDEILDDHVIVPESAKTDGKFFDGSKLRDLKSLAKGCVEDISPDTKIIFEDVIQVEFVDEHNNPIGTTERTNFLEINEENLPTIEKQLSQRNIIQELQKELTASMDSINKLARARSLKLQSEKSRSSEALIALKNSGKSTQEAPELSTPSGFKKTMSLRETRRPKTLKDQVQVALQPIDKKTIAKVEEITKVECKDAQPEESKKDEVRVVVDEEDGLKLSEIAVQMINEELAKEQLPTATEEQLLTSAKAGGSLKKKVSFKRKSKQDDPERVYEDVKVTDGKDGKEKDLKMMDISQSMSVDEEKTYLDEKIIKSTSLEEDYNKWSKITDHEYEPVNPPPDDGKPAPPPIQPEEVPKSRPSSMPTSIRIPLADDLVVDDQNMEAEEHLTSEQLQAQIEDQFFNQPTVSINPTTSDSKSVSSNKEPQESQAKKIQDAMKTQADKIRTKFKNMKRPHISMPQKPNLDKLKMKKPNINLPKLPDQMKLNLPSFTLPKKTTVTKTKVTTKQRQYSTESNVGEPKKKLFDFSTYPRLFHRKKTDNLDDLEGDESATLPRAKKDGKKKTQVETSEKKKKDSPDVIRIPLHSEESMDREDLDLSSHRYDPDIELENDYVRESQEMHKASPFTTDLSRNRWNHGSFHGHNLHEIEPNEDVKVTDLDNDLDIPQETKVDDRSISSSGDVHRRGVLEEINSDEFFLRQKGVSQDNIEMGAYLTSEIREAFRQPVNTLSKMQTDDSFEREIETSDPSTQEKKRQIKKPKRKKTPNVSREQIPYDQESEPEEYPQEPKEQPTRPKRRSKKKKAERVTPYQESIETNVLRKAHSDKALIEPHEDEHHFYDGDFRKEYPQLYENEQMEGIQQPNILLSDPYYHKEMILHADEENGLPEAPPRKQKSLKSLNSEHDSIIDEIRYANQHVPTEEIESYRLEHEYIIPTPDHPPSRPTRTRSRTRSQSSTTNKPDEEIEEPCVEEPCIKQACDYMGYAIVDKSKVRDPPLPPPPRKKKTSPSSLRGETKFFTCPRPLKDEAPVRPLRNYSTLIPRQRRSIPHEEKENIDIEQYIEIEDDDGHSTRLQSGDVLKKMKDRPLPAPPRPPRKQKESSKSPFADITHESNIPSRDEPMDKSQESEASVQTEPLPDDFVCEEFVQEKGDKVLTPTKNKPLPIREFEHQETVTHGALIVAPVGERFEEGPITNFSRSTEKIITIRREVDHEDSEIPEEFKMLRDPQSTVSERHHPEKVEFLQAQKLQVGDLDVDRLTVNHLLASKIKVSEIDSDSIHVAEINPETGSITIGGIELPAGLLQSIVGTLHQAQASDGKEKEKEEEKKEETAKEVKDEIKEVKNEELVKNVQKGIIEESSPTDGPTDLQLEEAIRIEEEKILREQEAAFANEVQMRLEQEIMAELGEVPPLTPDHSDQENPLKPPQMDEQKKTPIEEEFDPEEDFSAEPPVRPPRQSHRPKFFEDDIDGETPDLIPSDSTPPPRPPEPFEPYFRSQAPPSFFMLHSPNLREFIDDDIPMPPRRKRLQVPPSRSSSEEAAPSPRGRRHRTPEPSIPQLAGQLTRACLTAGEKAFKRLVKHITTNVLQNSDGRQDLHVMVVILLVLIAGLLLLSSGEKTVHMHHWEYFNPPRDL